MNDIDPSLLADAIFGGPYPPPSFVKSTLKQLGVSTPFRVVAIAYTKPTPPGLERPALQLHPGLLYALLPRHGPIALPHCIHGNPVRCESAEQLIPAIRTAIVSLRQSQAQRGRVLDATQLHELLRLTATLVTQPQHSATQTLRFAVQAILAHHLDHLASARRRILELASLMTEAAGSQRTVSLAFDTVLTRVAETFDYKALQRVAEQTLTRLAAAIGRARPPAPAADAWADRAQAVIDAHFRRPISLADVAEAVGCSAPHLARQYKAATGKTVVEALQDRRLDDARRRLLNAPDTPLHRIATASGFGCVEHLHRLFVRRFGVTPAAWRRSPNLA